jgi:hypothetical protein
VVIANQELEQLQVTGYRIQVTGYRLQGEKYLKSLEPET